MFGACSGCSPMFDCVQCAHFAFVICPQHVRCICEFTNCQWLILMSNGQRMSWNYLVFFFCCSCRFSSIKIHSLFSHWFFPTCFCCANNGVRNVNDGTAVSLNFATENFVNHMPIPNWSFQLNFPSGLCVLIFPGPKMSGEYIKNDKWYQIEHRTCISIWNRNFFPSNEMTFKNHYEIFFHSNDC